MVIKETDIRSEPFTALPISSLVKGNLAQAGFVMPTPIQAGAIRPALEGKDILGTSKTGSGKTLAFSIPIIEQLLSSKGQGIEALVLLPTRELAMQVLDTLRLVGKGSGVFAALVVGGLSEGKQLDDIRRGARLVIATPGRLDDYVKRRLVNLQNVKILVLDEADRMVDMGFLPQMRSIMNAMSKEHQTMCFSATMEREVAQLVHAYLKNPVHVAIGSTLAPAESVDLKIYEVIREQKFPLLVYLLESEPGTFLVFTRTKHGADKVLRKLLRQGYDAAVLHGGKSQSQRQRALDGFKAGHHRILVATDIAARGIHVSGIAHVINYDMPGAPEDFVHRVGRTGRVEETGTATTFVMPEEIGEIRAIERKLGRQITRLVVPTGLPTEPRSIHDEVMDAKSKALGGGLGRRFHTPHRRFRSRR